MNKKTGYYIYGRTACSCCREDNFISGMYDTIDAGIEEMAVYEKYARVCSQYSPTGIYTLFELEYEQLEDGRIIIDKYIFEPGFCESGHTANDVAYRGKSIIQTGKYTPWWP